MAKIQKRAKAGKHLKRGKKLEATRPLKTAKGGTNTGQTQTYLTYTLKDVIISNP
jgi:type VI protein secretion system component Hcp